MTTNKHHIIALLLITGTLICPSFAQAFPSTQPKLTQQALDLVPHKAIYDIELSKIKNGSQLLDIDGQMYFAMDSSCEGWVTDHLFSLVYDYQDNPPVKMTSQISSFESYNGQAFTFAATRKKNGVLYEEIKGTVSKNKNNRNAVFTKPHKDQKTLTSDTLLPAQHTYALLQHAKSGTRHVNIPLFDGNDTDGTKDVSAFISEVQNSPYHLKNNGTLYKIDLAFFPQNSKSEQAEYEMTIYIHRSGIIPFMLINYGSFTMTQRLKTFETLKITQCMN